MFENKNLAENLTNMAENLKKVGHRWASGAHLFKLWKFCLLFSIVGKDSTTTKKENFPLLMDKGGGALQSG